MLEHINFKNILFIDIETVPQYLDYNSAPKNIAHLWDKKFSTLKKEPDDNSQNSYHRAGIYAEFGKVICVSCGYLNKDDVFHLKSFYGHDEKQILSDFATMLNKAYYAPDKFLCGHNGKEFDFPYLCRRMLLNGIPLPLILNTAGKKPWEVSHLDTMELWKFGDYKSFTSLELLASIFNIPTPKDDIDGSMVWRVYWEDDDLERIARYCEKDVITVAQIFRRFRLEELVNADDVVVG